MDKVDIRLLEMDAQLVDGVAKGDALAWEEFVRRYTGWALYGAGRWCERHCPHRASDLECGIKSLSMRVADKTPPRRKGEECDEGMDTYIWILEQLKKRIMRYTGKNSSRLSTFVWRVLNSRELYIDWLRWKYGRIL